jgi:hypothetical protein
MNSEHIAKMRAGRKNAKVLNPIEKSDNNPTSVRKAVDAHCYVCNCMENWVSRTKYCQIFDCPLWKIRKNGKGVTREMCEEANVQ